MAYAGKLYQVKLIQQLHGEEILNVFFYGNLENDGTAQDLALTFDVAGLAVLNNIQTADLQYKFVEVENLFDESDFHVEGVQSLGLVVGQTYPSVVALNFTLRPSSRAVRPGSKRFAGIGESAGSGNTVNDPSYLSAIENVRVFLSQVLNGVGGLDADYVPSIVKRIPYTTPQGNPAYRLPETAAEADVFTVTTALFKNTFSHQTTRGN